MRRLHHKLATLIVLFVLPLVSISCGQEGTNASASKGAGGGPGGGEKLPVRKVQVANSESRSLTRTVTAPGTLAADEQATLSFKVAGRLNEMRVDLGTVVKKGQVIAQLETSDFRGRVNQAEAGLQQARVRLGLQPQGGDDRIVTDDTSLVRQARAVLEEAQLNRERTMQLVNQGIQSKAELDRADSAFKVADSRYQDAVEEVRNREAIILQRRSELSLARQQLAETTLYVPFDGAVRERRAAIGEYMAAGAPVVTIVRLHPLRMRVEVPEREAQGIRVGQPVKVTVEGDMIQSHSGRVARLSPAFQEQSRTLIIEAEVDNQQGRLRPGSFAKAEIQTTSTSSVITVPASAVVTFAGIQKIFLVQGGKAVERNVVLGRREGDWIVVEGVEPGLPVVISPGNLVAGQSVAVE